MHIKDISNMLFFAGESFELKQMLNKYAMEIMSNPNKALPDWVKSNVSPIIKIVFQRFLVKPNNSIVNKGNKNWTKCAGSLKNEDDRSASDKVFKKDDTLSIPREFGKKPITPGIREPSI